jgi:HEAT repeat protein
METVNALVEELKSDDCDFRWRAGWALGRLKNADAIDSLIRTLQDNDPDVRWRAAWALGQIGDARAAGPLAQALEDDYSNVRWSAAEALGVLKDENAVDQLIRLLNSPGEQTMIRLVAADALGKIGGSRAEVALEAVVLRDESAPSRLFTTQHEKHWSAQKRVSGRPKSRSPPLFSNPRKRVARTIEPLSGQTRHSDALVLAYQY